MGNAEEQRTIHYVNYFTIACAEYGQTVSIKMFARTPDFDATGKPKDELCQEVAHVVMTAHNASILSKLIQEVQDKFEKQTDMEKQHG